MTARKSSGPRPRKRATSTASDTAATSSSSRGIDDPARAIARGNALAKEFLKTALRCDVCGGRIAARGMRRHAMCEPGTLAGKVCTCRGDCTDKVWGDRGSCDPACEPCQIMRGQRYVKR